MIDTILFDLDGTLTDPGEGITNSVAFALKRFGITVENKKDLYVFIGPPLVESFMKYYGFTEEDAKTAVDYYREYFSEIGIFENAVYDGIHKMLSDLKKHGKRLVLATSKPEIFAIKILKHFDLEQYFCEACGSELDHKRTDKHEVIEYALSKITDVNRENTVMVGDRFHDINGGKKSKLLTVGVTYGYGSYDELINSNADMTVNTVDELNKLLMSI